MTATFPTAGRTRIWLAVVVFAVGSSTGCGVAVRNAGPTPEPVREPSRLRDIIELYRTNPAKAFHTYRDKPQHVIGIVPRKTSQLSEFKGLYQIACDIEGQEPTRDADFQVICTEEEASSFDVGTPGKAILILKQSDMATTRPVFFTPAGVERMGEETRRKQRGN